MHTDYVMVRDGDDAAGATTWWRLTGPVARTKIVACLEQTNTNTSAIAAPPPVDAETALRRAVGTLRGPRRLVRPVRRGVWAIIDEGVEGESLKHWAGPSVSLDKVGRLVVRNMNLITLDAGDSAALEDRLRATYTELQDQLTPEDISAWLIRIATTNGAVSLRTGGGIYYLPPIALAVWRMAAAVLERATNQTHAVFIVPTVRMTIDGARAVIDGLQAEIRTEVEALRAEVISGDLGVNALATRKRRTKSMLEKVSAYEQILQQPLGEVSQSIDTLAADLSAAILAAEQEDA